MTPLLALVMQAAEQTATAAKEVAVASTQPAELGSITMGGLAIFFIQRWFKSFNFYQSFVQKFPGADKWAHLVFAGAASLFVITGIHITGSWSAELGGTYQIQLPPVANIIHGLVAWGQQFGVQQWMYLAARSKDSA